MKVIELWADSFHEGDWACEHLANIHSAKGYTVNKEYKNGFLPVYTFDFPNRALKITVYGSYNSWTPLPPKIEDLISWGKPDFLAYDPETEEILFAVEETAAVPTGNQALQRCERLYGSARSSIPFWYLLAEYGTHKDGGIRRDSIWPSIMALKLSFYYRTPCAILHYADAENPEGYDFGKGVEALFNALYLLLDNFVCDKSKLAGLPEFLTDHYMDMLRFIDSQHENIISYIPELDKIDHKSYSSLLSKIAVSSSNCASRQFKKQYSDFLVWPQLSDWEERSGAISESTDLIKYDYMSELLETSLDNKKSYSIGFNAGSRPQKASSMKGWIEKQNQLNAKYSTSINPHLRFNMDITDFPTSDSGNHHVTTAKNIVYLFDRFHDLKSIIYEAWPRLREKLDNFNSEQKTFIYISNSIKPGRIFGDPFTGQISAYSTAFGRFDDERRLIVAYFPHQSFSQIIDKKNKVKNKGLTILREMVDVIIFSGGVAVSFDDNGRAIAL